MLQLFRNEHLNKNLVTLELICVRTIREHDNVVNNFTHSYLYMLLPIRKQNISLNVSLMFTLTSVSLDGINSHNPFH